MQTGRRGRPNRQPLSNGSSRAPDTNSRGRERGRGSSTPFDNNRGPGRGFNPRPRPSPDYRPVPPYAFIHPGTPVSIILKQDQPTGHQVKGIVADLLTRGDHPRGVKVRLRDGRVGRVQQVVNEAEGVGGEALVGGSGANLGRNGDDGGRGRRMVGGRVEKDIREDDEYLYDERRRVPAEVGLFAALEEADRRHQASTMEMDGQEEVVMCPVCGVFEGGEVAVARHVEEHFGK